MSKEQLKNQIAKGKLQTVITTLLAVTEGEQHNEVVHLSSRFADLKQQQNKGILSESQAELKRNRIADSLLALVEDLPDDIVLPDVSETVESEVSSEKKKLDWKKWGAIAVTTIAVLAGIAKISGYSLRDIFASTSSEEALTLTIKVRDLEGNRPLKGEGNLVVDYGNGTRTERIDEDGKVDVREIPNHLKGNEISILLEDAKNYKAIDNTKKYVLDGKPITFLVQLDQQLGIVKGKVRSRDGKQFLADVLIEVAGETTYSDSLGNFHLELPSEKWKSEYTLFARKGERVKEEKYYPNLDNFEIRLED